MSITVTVGDCLLRYRRKARGFTQEQLAKRIGKTKSQISDWERSRNIMELETAKAIAIQLGCHIDDLYEWIIEESGKGK